MLIDNICSKRAQAVGGEVGAKTSWTPPAGIGEIEGNIKSHSSIPLERLYSRKPGVYVRLFSLTGFVNKC